MTTANLTKYLKQKIALYDKRTGEAYVATVLDVKTQWGKILIQVATDGPWFEPTSKELASVAE